MNYDYECDNCGRFEVKQSMYDDALQVCPKCGNGVRRIIVLPPRPIWKGRLKWFKGNPELKEEEM